MQNRIIYFARPLLATLALLGVVQGLASCTTTQIQTQWRDPASISYKLSGKVLVAGLTLDETTRRLYEDSMVDQLTSHGVTALPSYQFLNAPLTATSNTALTSTARNAGATAIVSSALIAHTHVHDVVVEPLPAWGRGYTGWYGYHWGLATRTEVRTYDHYVVGTSLVNAETGKILWTARTVTEPNNGAQREIKTFAKVIVSAMADAGLM